MNQIFLGEPSQEIKNWFVETFPSWPSYTTLKFGDGTTEIKEISGAATWQNIGVKSDQDSWDTTLKSCQLGKNVTEIGERAFYHCRLLSLINIPNSVSSIGGMAFAACEFLNSIDIPNSVTSIGTSAFSNCDYLTLINIPNSVSSIGDGAFYHCYYLTSINIPNSVTSIGTSAFYYCDSLTSVIFEGKTKSQITSMANYPWGIENTSIIKAGIS